jgi:hypothetical protein
MKLRSAVVLSVALCAMAAYAQKGGPMSVSFHVPARSGQAIPDLIDLTAYYTSSLKDGNLDSLPQGVQAFFRAAFDIRGVIQVPAHRDAVMGIGIHRKAEKIDFLHGAAGHAAEDAVVGSYVLHYADGETRKIPLVYGRNVKDSFRGSGEPVLTDAAAVPAGKGAQVFKYTANNPLPGIEIKTMDFVSSHTAAAPFLIAVTVEPVQAERTYEWFDSIRAWNRIPPRDPAAGPDQVDLTAYYGTSLNDDWFNHPGHDLHDVPQGLKRFGGVWFDVRGLIVLAGGTNSLAVSGLALPEQVLGIPVGRKGKTVDFLQAAAFTGSTPGLKIGAYVIHYENGETRTADLVYGENELDWWGRPGDSPLTNADEVWRGSNTATRSVGMYTRLMKFAWKNPLPDVKITSFDFVSALASSSPMLVAVTVEP